MDFQTALQITKYCVIRQIKHSTSVLLQVLYEIYAFFKSFLFTDATFKIIITAFFNFIAWTWTNKLLKRSEILLFASYSVFFISYIKYLLASCTTEFLDKKLFTIHSNKSTVEKRKGFTVGIPLVHLFDINY